MDWTPAPPKPADFCENQLIDAILKNHFPIGSNLPAERDLAGKLGITRPTLREALQRMACDGWIEIHHGKPTRVRNYWHEGSLAVLSAIARRSKDLPDDFVPNLLFVRQLLAPTYTYQAIDNAPESILAILKDYPDIEETPEAFTAFDWQLHHQLTIASRNPVFTLILNGFNELYHHMGCFYFSVERTRQHSRGFYRELQTATLAHDASSAHDITHRVMGESLILWQRVQSIGGM